MAPEPQEVTMRKDRSSNPAKRVAALLLLLTKRDAAGHPVPVALLELRDDAKDAAGQHAASTRLQRDLRAIADAGWVLHKQGKPAYVYAEHPSANPRII